MMSKSTQSKRKMLSYLFSNKLSYRKMFFESFYSLGNLSAYKQIKLSTSSINFDYIYKNILSILTNNIGWFSQSIMSLYLDQDNIKAESTLSGVCHNENQINTYFITN